MHVHTLYVTAFKLKKYLQSGVTLNPTPQNIVTNCNNYIVLQNGWGENVERFLWQTTRNENESTNRTWTQVKIAMIVSLFLLRIVVQSGLM